MIKNIRMTSIVVSDQDASLAFYVDKLGWEKRIDAEMGPDYRFLTVAPVGSEAELVLGPVQMICRAPGSGFDTGELGMGIQSGITLTVENMDETYQTLVGKGVKFAKPPEEMPWGDKGAWMLDPDGNSFFLAGR